jgi:hypothetical protein
MADDQATLGTFADSDSDGDESDDEGSASDGPGAGPDGDDGPANGRDEAATGTDALADDLVCPWCLAPAAAFVERGLTGLACGRCSATLPTGAEWFRERDVVARRPMYEVED